MTSAHELPLLTDLALPYRFIPSRRNASGLLILLHGVGSNELSLAGLATGVADDVAIALVRSPIQIGPSSFCAFQVEFTAHGPVIDAPAAETSRQRLLTFVCALQEKLVMPPARTLVAGFSQGGIMAAGLALTAPTVLAGFAILSGRILPEIEPRCANRAELGKLNALIVHGESDTTLPVSWAERSAQWLAELGVPYQSKRYPTGHQITPEIARDFVAWVARQLP